MVSLLVPVAPAARPYAARKHSRRLCAARSGGEEAAPPAPKGGGGGGAERSLPAGLSKRSMGMSAGVQEQESEAAASSSGANAGGLAAAEEAGIGKWAETYKQQEREQDGEAGEAGSSTGPFLLPLMTLSKSKMPTESVALQIFESRYRIMFKLVNQSRSRRFGVVLADKTNGVMESVGALCELTHFVTVPERQRLFINARVIGRFQTEQVVNDKPFITVLGSRYNDIAPQELTDQLQLGALEMRVWQTMQDVRQLASKLFVKGGSKLGNEIFSLEVRRWSPDGQARAEVPTAAGADPTLMRMVQLAGLLGEEETMGERTTEYLCSDMLRQVSEAERRERFSFALARTLDFEPHRRQELLYCQDTGERLRASEELILEGRNYLAARSTLRDMF